MPLIPNILENSLKTKIKSKEKKLNELLINKANGIYDIFVEIDNKVSKNIPTSNFNTDDLKQQMWQHQTKEWSEKLSKNIIKFLADDISKILAEEITNYLRQAVVQVGPSGTGTIS